MSKFSRKIAISILLVVCVVFTCACNLVKSPDYYELNEDDVVTSFTKVVGERKVNTQKIEMTNAVQSIAYSYKEVEDVYVDVEQYIDYLSGEEDFYHSGLLSMDEKEDEITLSKTSPNNEEYEIKVIIKYSVDTKIVKVTVQREKKM